MKSVMLVEDSEMFYTLLKKTLNPLKVIWSRSGEEAIENYEKNKPDLVLMDVILPDMNGIDVIRKIKKIDEDAKIIVLSGIDHDDVVVDAKKAGAVDYISKSSGISYLKNRVYEELDI